MLHEEYLKVPNINFENSTEDKNKSILPPDARHDHRLPKIGDVIGCIDGGVGIIVSTSYRRTGITAEQELMVGVAWSNEADICIDPWRSQDFKTSEDRFWIMSRA